MANTTHQKAKVQKNHHGQEVWFDHAMSSALRQHRTPARLEQKVAPKQVGALESIGKWFQKNVGEPVSKKWNGSIFDILMNADKGSKKGVAVEIVEKKYK